MHSAVFDAAAHHAFIDRLRQTCFAPSRHEVSAALAAPVEDVEKALLRLARSHDVVLHPHVCEPWVIHPFSFYPTHCAAPAGSRPESKSASRTAGCLAPCSDASIHSREI
jgi:hypothetical protein